MNNEEYTGVLLDSRPEEAKSKDFNTMNLEFASATPLNWVEKDVPEWVNYPSRNQVNSSSCVAQAFAKALFTMGLSITSAHPIYRSRKNFIEKGMWLYDGADILKKQGTVLEAQSQSQMLGEDEMNRAISDEVKAILNTTPTKIGGYVYVARNDFNGIAQAIADNKHCVITVQSSYPEWTSIPVVQGTPNWGHAVCAVDYILYKGKKYIVIEDSWGSNATEFDDRRLLSEEFINARCTGAMYLLPVVPQPPLSYTFTKVLKKGDNNSDVNMLQRALKTLGFFPQIDTTNYFGNVTRNAVNKFQLAYKDEILTPQGLIQPTGVFGASSIKKLNELMKNNKQWFISSIPESNDLSLTLKGALLAVVPMLVTFLTTHNILISESQITDIINSVFTIVSIVIVLYGSARKGAIAVASMYNKG